MAMILDVKKFGCFPSKMFICQKIKTTAKKKKITTIASFSSMCSEKPTTGY